MDWNHELLGSVFWLGKAMAITLPSSVLALWLVVRFTTWGRQFWRLAGEFFLPAKSGWRPILVILLILLITLTGVRINVLFSNWYNGMYTALQKWDEKAFWLSMLVFTILATAHVARALFSYFIQQTFLIRWREWLNESLLQRWLNQQAYYRSSHLANPSDNPDQRIQQDVASFVSNSLALSMGVIDALVSTFEFTMILWGLSGVLNLFGVEIPRAMVFIAYIYVIVATVLAFHISRPLIRLNFLNEKLNADYRYALIRMREYGESVAFYRGEEVEGHTLRHRFVNVIDNMWAIVYRTLKFSGFNLVVSQTAVVFPFLIQAKRFFAKQISLGDMVQTAQAFGQLQDNLSFFRNAFDSFAEYKAVLDRLTGFLDSVEAAAQLPQPTHTLREGGLILHDLNVRRPDQEPLLSKLDLTLEPGHALLIRGPSGSGKTTLLRAIAGLWPYCDGKMQHPAPEHLLFLSQRPYLPLGTLRDALYYPKPAAQDDAAAVAALKAVHLGQLASKLDVEADWSHTLSLGEQQRLAFGRLLLAAPHVAFLDEATSAMDEGLEDALYRLLRQRLPHTTLVSVGHRSSLLVHHDLQLQLHGAGNWQLQAS
ncbi:ABC transporter ATP-binding protein/permease [Vogesella sp. LIG4]|uniref:ABC transporter ATP-binding protein/permease n=1 Tax=Vogesella sp. LIG4 TaxID=1192162 RepID=UPI00081FF43D|nr:ABC transporter ATP-binding protein/permease [Vogesella sp. LIG4]SCK21054.1 putative ATP-binding cassette transporter [Vogesella sp. LIG4]